MEGSSEAKVKYVPLPSFGVFDEETEDPTQIIAKAEEFLKDLNVQQYVLDHQKEDEEVIVDGVQGDGMPRTEFPFKELKRMESQILKGKLLHAVLI